MSEFLWPFPRVTRGSRSASASRTRQDRSSRPACLALTLALAACASQAQPVSRLTGDDRPAVTVQTPASGIAPAPTYLSSPPPTPAASAPATPALAAYEAGLDARARGDIRAASLLFEQALMFDPDFAGAWYDYALSLCELGDPAGCGNLVETAVARFGLPPAMQARPRTLASHTGELRVGLGASTNLSRSTHLADLTLQLDGLPVIATLDPRFRERGGGYAEVGLRWDTRWPLQDITARLDLTARKPSSSRLPDFMAGYGEVGIGVRPRTRVGLLALGVDEDYLGAITAVGAFAEHRFSPQGMSVRTAFEYRHPRGQAGWNTVRMTARVPLGTQWAVQTGWEYDLPQAQRAGRSQQRLLLDVRSEFSLPAVAGRIPRLALGAGVLHARDRDPYSPLFGDIRNRRTRYQATADLSVNLNRDWRVNLGLLAARQRASVELFDYREASATLSLIYLFQ